MVQRGVDTAAEWSDVLAEKLNAAANPRANWLRKRRWALRLALFSPVSAVFWVGVTPFWRRGARRHGHWPSARLPRPARSWPRWRFCATLAAG